MMMEQVAEKSSEDVTFTITDLSKDFTSEQVKKIKEVMLDDKNESKNIRPMLEEIMSSVLYESKDGKYMPSNKSV